MVAQLLLPMPDRERDAIAGIRVRAACKVVAKELGHKAIAELWGCDESTVGLKLNEQNRNYIRPSEMLALKRVDSRGLIEAAEDVELRPTLTASDVVARIPGVLREFFAEELAEHLERRFGMRP